MILSDVTIAELINSKQIIIEPEFDMKNIRPTGIRMHLGDELLIPEPDQTIDISGTESLNYQKVTIPKEGYTMKPGDFVLASTYERFQVPRTIVCHIDGRSTIARLGLTVHCTSHTIDGNFDDPRTVVYEMKNMGPTNLILKPRVALALLSFTQLSTPIRQDSQQQYKGQNGVVAPNLKVQKE
jgi:dCTP deaminase